MTCPLVIRAGPLAQDVLAQGWDWSQFEVVVAASGGPKWLILSALDRHLVELLQGPRPIHLLGSSSGAWRFAAYCQQRPQQALARLEEAYIEADWNHHRPLDQRGQTAVDLLAAFAAGSAPEVLEQDRFRLHVVTALCKSILAYDHPIPQHLGLLGAALLTSWSRRAVGHLVERALFSDPRGQLPSPLDDLTSHVWPLTRDNFEAALLASGAIPTVLPGIRAIPQGPPGCLRDGGLVDYHFDQFCLRPQGLILYPHFAPRLMPSWLEHFHRNPPQNLHNWDRMVLIHPDPEWVNSLPGGKIPDRIDALRMSQEQRKQIWHEGARRGQELAEALDRAVKSGPILPLLGSR